MGKNKKKTQDRPATGHSAATVFISNLPYSFTNSQLEETFSDVGPIRRCFMVTKKGSDEHRGFGFVQFAVAEHANTAVQTKNGSSIGGRKIGVKHAMHRAPLEQRRSNAKAGDTVEAKTVETEPVESMSKPLELPIEARQVEPSSERPVKPSSERLVKPNSERPVKSNSERLVEPNKVASLGHNVVECEKSSEKPRVPRTVVFGGLRNADMADHVHNLAKEVGVCSVTYPLPGKDLEQHGLAQDGCRPEASAVVYNSIKLARLAVESLHNKEIKGGVIWARQLGGEGSKTKKWKVIVRNIPFKAKVDDIRKMFSAVGFVWDVFIPQNSESGLAKGFAFVKFTSRQDAEKAIQKFNGQIFGKRPIAVDWAVPKKIYQHGKTDTDMEEGQEKGDISGEDLEDDDEDFDQQDPHPSADKDEDSSNSIGGDAASELNFDEEVDVAKRVLNNLLSSSVKGTVPSKSDDSDELPEEMMDPVSTETNGEPMDLSDEHKQSRGVGESVKSSTKVKEVDEEELLRTIFISNLPFDVDADEVKQRFSAFGDVQSFFPVLHKVTKRPRGTGFLKFKTADAADAATAAAAQMESGLGILLKGRQLKVLKALDKTSAQKKEMEKAKPDVQDQRNLYLAKEGIIVEGTPAAEGVSESDMIKRNALEREKMTKLQSPKFHVSRTRLIVHNLPKSYTEKEVKKLFIDAVKSRATKQTPVIKQVKMMTNMKKGKDQSRGIAFVDFTEHQHALVALRVLNNNPETFGPQHRPIVGFSLDNVVTLRKRQAMFSQAEGSGGAAKDDNTWSSEKVRIWKAATEEGTARRGKEHRPNDSSAGPDTAVGNDGGSSDKTDKSRKRKARDGTNDNKMRKRGKEGPSQTQETAQEDDSDTASPSQKKLNNRNRDNNKKQKKASSSVAVEVVGSKAREEPLEKKRKLQEEDRRGAGQRRRDNSESNYTKAPVLKKKNKKEKKGSGDVHDKLDKLIEQYRSKFSQQTSSDGQKQAASKKLRRWFES